MIKIFFKSDHQQMISDFAKEQQEKYSGNESQSNEAKQQEMDKLRNLLAENIKKSDVSSKGINLTV
ncbi:hypothetical protein BVY03_04215 [bacterium K02(2017)]|nr:hypothetical protein BVY03_04215 [bacterium K02(2017)]